MPRYREFVINSFVADYSLCITGLGREECGMMDEIIEIFIKFIMIYCIGCFGGSLLWKTKID
ncbi:hypothetical protein BAU28_15990 [Bacillus paramycoides]|uniref:Uncharacterized protein n=1 Tax=Bacillus paramycoides TaxID=2026194 RepID=A0A1J9VLW4_9BACI|nr:hypothetical protein BAU28_15990 [Bacillus paramycoides]